MLYGVFRWYFKGSIIILGWKRNNKFYKYEDKRSKREDRKYTTNSTGYLLCEGIEKLTWTNNFKYIVGYIELSKQGLCKGYFYINSNDEKDYKFNLTKKEVEEKFGKDIKYQKSIDFINIFGENSFNEENISEIISFYELVTFFGSILLYILLNILNSIMYIIKIKE